MARTKKTASTRKPGAKAQLATALIRIEQLSKALSDLVVAANVLAVASDNLFDHVMSNIDQGVPLPSGARVVKLTAAQLTRRKQLLSHVATALDEIEEHIG